MSEKAFSQYANKYDSHFTNTLIGKEQRNAVYNFLKKNFLPIKNNLEANLLELNCGTGADAIWLEKKKFNIKAIDVSEGMIKVANSKIIGSEKKIEFIQTPIQSIRNLFKNNYFDMVFSNFGGLNCLDKKELKKLSKDCFSLTKNEAYLSFVIMGRKCINEKLFFTLKKEKNKVHRRLSKDSIKANIEGEPCLTWYYSPNEIKDIFYEEFEFVTHKPIGFLIPPSYLEALVKKLPNIIFKLICFFEKICLNMSFLSDYSDHYIILLKKRNI